MKFQSPAMDSARFPRIVGTIQLFMLCTGTIHAWIVGTIFRGDPGQCPLSMKQRTLLEIGLEIRLEMEVEVGLVLEINLRH